MLQWMHFTQEEQAVDELETVELTYWSWSRGELGKVVWREELRRKGVISQISAMKIAVCEEPERWGKKEGELSQRPLVRHPMKIERVAESTTTDSLTVLIMSDLTLPQK